MSRASLLCLTVLAAFCSRPDDDERMTREQFANYTKTLDTGDVDLAARVYSLGAAMRALLTSSIRF